MSEASSCHAADLCDNVGQTKGSGGSRKVGRRSRGKGKEGERRKKQERTTTRFLEVSFRADPLFQPGISLDQGEGNDGKCSPAVGE